MLHIHICKSPSMKNCPFFVEDRLVAAQGKGAEGGSSGRVGLADVSCYI